MNFGHIKNIHFVGIGGIGMSGIAEILSSYDLSISGCDLKSSAVTERLSGLGIPVAIGHSPAHVRDMDLIVISSAVKPSSEEVAGARSQRIPVIRRAEMLGELTRLKRSVAIAGTHGKTSTSAMAAMVLSEAGLDPTLIVGGVLRNIDSNARLGLGEYLVVEADEYDRSFLRLSPTWAVVTNIEADHLDCYRDLDDIRATFAQFAGSVPFFGAIIGCSDDENVESMLQSIEKRAVRYGLGDRADVRASEIRFEPAGTSFSVEHRGRVLGRISLRVPGEHNVRNALAAVAAGLELDVPFETIAAGLGRFTGVQRRFQIIGEYQGALIVDDYAHHPTEIAATLEAARRTYPERRLVALFQPHLYSRTRDFSEGFAQSLRLADVAFVSPIYAAREEPIAGVSAGMIVDAAQQHGATNVQLVDRSGDGLIEHFRAALRSGDIFVTMGAGDVNRVGEALVGAKI
ncbi:MAG: UDP-N-acetylmuramate--L-alanine ligase [Acidobacteriota bacterium]